MTCTVTIGGEFRNRLYINLILFKIARGWRSEPFHLRQSFELPSESVSWRFPIAGVPISALVSLQGGQLTASLEVLGQEIVREAVLLPGTLEKQFQFSPWKGVEVRGKASTILAAQGAAA